MMIGLTKIYRGAWSSGLKLCCGLLLLLLWGCSREFVPSEPTATLSASLPTLAAYTAAPQVTPAVTPAETPSLPSTPVPQRFSGPGLDLSGVTLFPEPIYAGDRLSLKVLPRLPEASSAVFSITLDLGSDGILSATVASQGLDAQASVRFDWFWQASAVGERDVLTLTLLLPPEVSDDNLADNTLLLPIEPLAIDSRILPEPEARWALTETEGVRIHYLTHSAAERDLAELVDEVAAAYAFTAERLAPISAGVDIYLLDRVIGQGGYASSAWVAISYSDRHYVPVSLTLVLRHEFTHRMDDAIGCRDAPVLLREGLAVYNAGGHYWAGSLRRDAAVLLAAGRYLSLPVLLENFYTHQHEIAYLEAGALVAYVVETYGWDAFESFCRVSAGTAESDALRLEAAVQALGFTDLPAFETTWLAWLEQEPVSVEMVELFDGELALMETVRAYQLAYNKSAHFLAGILFDPSEAERLGISADFVRRPRSADAVALECMLVLARDAIARGDAVAAQEILEQINVVLADGFPDFGMAADVHSITALLLAHGYEPYRFELREQGYWVQALERADWPAKRVLFARRSWWGLGWLIGLVRR